ncbi:MAG: 5-methyltetrahydropteroyltriglutamate--homocysteine S-methyltransferase, partial [Gemmatimonadota bacterium]
ARYLQFDEVPLAMLCDVNVRAMVEGYGEDPATLIDRYIELINACVAERPSGVTMALHMCRGNFKGRWLSEGGYDQVAERLFAGLNVDAFFLEYDTPRAGGFRPLRHVPDDKSVVLGLISTKSGALESADDIVARIEEAARIVPLERLAVSPQCGFSSTVAGNPLTLEDEEKKLRLLVDVSRRVWG